MFSSSLKSSTWQHLDESLPALTKILSGGRKNPPVPRDLSRPSIEDVQGILNKATTSDCSCLKVEGEAIKETKVSENFRRSDSRPRRMLRHCYFGWRPLAPLLQQDGIDNLIRQYLLFIASPPLILPVASSSQT